MINGYGCYLKYLSIKAHFLNEKYDYFKYQGRIKANISSFNKRPDRFFFEKLARTLKTEEAIERYFVSNFVYGTSLWIGDAITENANNNYLKWIGRIESIQYSFKKDLDNIISKAEKNECSIQELFESSGGQHPVILKMFLKKELIIESVIILNTFLDFFDQWNDNIKEQAVWPEVHKRFSKYEPFLYSYLNKDQLRSLRVSVKNKLIDN